MKKLVGATMMLSLAAVLSAAPQAAQTPTQPSLTPEKHARAHTGKKHQRTHTGNTQKPVVKSGN